MTPCAANNCDRPTHAKGLRTKHYQRSRRPPRKSKPTPEQRFWAKVEKTETCWLWMAALDDHGYGTFMMTGDRTPSRAHRVSYTWLVGEPPKGLYLDHLCRVRNCVNPSHLEPVTSGENTRRSPIHDEWQRSKTQCPNGHPYSGENLYVHGNRRHCRTCRKANSKARWEAKRADITERVAS